MPTRLYRLLGVLCMLVIAAPTTVAGEVPTDPDGFTDFVAKAYGKALPEAKIKVMAPLRLDITLPTGPHTAYLDNIWQHCQQSPQDCDASVAERVANYANLMREDKAPLTAETLRAVIRTTPYVEQMRKVGGMDPDAAPAARLLAGDLWIMCVHDTPHGAAYLRLRDLAPLKLSKDEAIVLAAKNLQASLRPMAEVAARVPHKGIGHIEGDYYDASRLLLHDDWAPVAKKLKGELIVAVPATDLVLYANAADPKALVALQALARDMTGKARRPVSATVLKWTTEGWQVAAQ